MFPLVIAFALLLTAHLTLVAGLARCPRRWRAVVALAAPPLAPYWGYRERMRGRASLWIASAAVYALLRLIVARIA